MKEVIETINRMKADGVIERYAIGGAVGATFYLEPVATIDVDVFVELHIPPGSQLVSPEPIFKYLRDRGCKMEGGARGDCRLAGPVPSGRRACFNSLRPACSIASGYEKFSGAMA